MPTAFGRDFFLRGYRIFTRLGGPASSRRGLRILRSDTDQPWMVRAGNLLTHYRYGLCQVERAESPRGIGWSVRTPHGEADLELTARIASSPSPLPAGSPFTSHAEARRFAGPLPYTFDYEPETNSIICIRGVRGNWNPRPVSVSVTRNTFLDRAHEDGTRTTAPSSIQLAPHSR